MAGVDTTGKGGRWGRELLLLVVKFSCNIKHRIRSSKRDRCFPVPFGIEVHTHSLIQLLANPRRAFHIQVPQKPKILPEALNVSGLISWRSPMLSSKLVLFCLSHLSYLLGQPVSEHTTKTGFTKDAEKGDSFSAVSQYLRFEHSSRVIVCCQMGSEPGALCSQRSALHMCLVRLGCSEPLLLKL